MEKIFIIGAGGFGREVLWLIERINSLNPMWEVVGFIDDGVDIGTIIDGIQVVGTTDELIDTKEKVSVVCAVGSAKVRKKIIENVSRNNNIKFPNIIDPSSISSRYIEMGQGNIVCASNVFTVNIRIGNFNILNLSCTIGHDVEIGDFNTIYPGVNVSGGVKLGNCVELGTGSKIIQGKNIGDNTIVGAGAVIIRDIDGECTVVGVPGYKRKK